MRQPEVARGISKPRFSPELAKARSPDLASGPRFLKRSSRPAAIIMRARQRRSRRRPVTRVTRLAAHLKHPLSMSNRRSRRLTRRDQTIVRLVQISAQKRTGLRILRNLATCRARHDERQRNHDRPHHHILMTGAARHHPRRQAFRRCNAYGASWLRPPCCGEQKLRRRIVEADLGPRPLLGRAHRRQRRAGAPVFHLGGGAAAQRGVVPMPSPQQVRLRNHSDPIGLSGMA